MGDTKNLSEGASGDLEETFEFELPPEKKVIIFNDDFTTMDFVVDILVSVFNKSHEEAEKLMKLVHNSGSAALGPYTYDIAVSRSNLAVSLARKNGFPLRVEVE